ncbi:hypothetical protein DES36_10228 [Alkalibaculum bacchi]|uniref:Uncharacterized protein n=1 Tax=Alkalibaculum bacchi TaxID=645887 RepID=A0A366IDQ5_9FIRM|nr:hypothetical protein DES36_10228 [Alkalibaculum bacchi]
MIAGTKPQGCTRGKSELHRAGCRVIPGGGDSKASATESKPPPKMLRIFGGKAETVR